MSNKDVKSQDPLTEAQKQHLKYFLTNKLTRPERLIIVLYYYDEMTMKEIAATLDLSEERVSQMHSSIVARLKAQMNSREREFGVDAAKMTQKPREQHYLFAHETIKDLFFNAPQHVIDKLKNNWMDFLLETWVKVGENLKKFRLVAPDGLCCEVRMRDDNTTVALITLPTPQVISEAYFVALVYRPQKVSFLSKQETVARFMLLEKSIPYGYGNLSTVLHEWTEDGMHNMGYGSEPNLEAFYETVCNLL